MSPKNLTTVLIAVLLLIVMAVGGYVLFLNNNAKRYSQEQTVNSVLEATNSSFAQGNNLMRAGKESEALTAYQDALKSAEDKAQEAQIKFSIASALERSGLFSDYSRSIEPFKEIARNASYPAIARAYAVQEIGLLRIAFNDQLLDAIIFAGSPYSEMLSGGDLALAYRHLFEYASQLYPLGISQAQIARWYADQLVLSTRAAKQSDVLSVEQTDAYTDKIRQLLASADADIERIKDTPSEKAYIPTILASEAIVIGKMQLSGDDSFGDLSSAYNAALTSYPAYGLAAYRDGWVRFNYASAFLQSRGSAGTKTVQEILAPFYSSDRYKNSAIEKFLTRARADTSVYAEDYDNIVSLAKLDAQFASYLRSLGWTDSDFSSQVQS